MATIKSFTSLEQSKKLAEILPLESADMYFHYDYDFDELESIPTIMEEDDHFALFPKDVRCWSLAALLGVLPILDNKHAVFGTSIKESKWHVVYHNIETLFIEDSGLHSNLVDACVAMIEKLNELNLL